MTKTIKSRKIFAKATSLVLVIIMLFSTFAMTASAASVTKSVTSSSKMTVVNVKSTSWFKKTLTVRVSGSGSIALYSSLAGGYNYLGKYTAGRTITINVPAKHSGCLYFQKTGGSPKVTVTFNYGSVY